MDLTFLITWALGTSYGPYIVTALTILGGAVTIASAIAPFTTTTKDDEAVAFMKSLVQRFSVVKPTDPQ
jgi:hypothetical protein